MVLFLFVVMLLNAPREEALVRATIPLALGGRPLRVGVVLGTIFFVEIAWALSRVGGRPMGGDAATAATVQSVRQVGLELFTTHAFAFEVTSVLILVAMVGAVALAKRNL
jgi:NADH-quinone oxidoreductase subunit J